MKNLLDTHIVLWLAGETDKLSAKAKRAIFDPSAENHVSVASCWEVTVKFGLKKLEIDGGISSFYQIIKKCGFHLLPIEQCHLETLEDLPFHHRDPFDRLLVATALCGKMRVITADANIHRYAVPHIW